MILCLKTLSSLQSNRLRICQPSATTLLPGQDRSPPSDPISGTSWFVASCWVRLSVRGFTELRKSQVVRSIRIADSIPHFVRAIPKWFFRSLSDSFLPA
jgi:hypothetical protein